MKTLSVCLVVCLALVFPAIASAQGSDAELSGNYAFTFDGITGANGVSNGYAGVGRFTANGAGTITNGEVDTNAVGGGLTAQPFTGSYSIGADHRGVMTLNIAGSTKKFAIAMKADGSAKFVETDAVGGAGTIGSGSIEKSDATAYNTAQINGEYAFGIAGQDNANNRAAITGRFTSAGAGTLTNVAGDVNAYGTVSPLTFTSATYAVSNTATGRGTMHLSFAFSGGAVSLNFAFYIVNSGKLFAMATDTVTSATPLLNGVVQRQRPPTGGFTNASLNSNMVLYMTGLAACGNVTGTVPKAVAGVLTPNGAGSFSLSFDENFCSAPRAVTAAPGTYSVASNGRTTMALDGDGVIGYLVDANTGFLITTDPAVLSGFGEPQTAGALTNSSVTGAYAGVATDPTAFTVNVFSGEFSANGASPTGNLTGHEDIGDASNSQSGASFAATYAVSSSPTNGRGTVNLTSPSGGTAVVYVISPTKFVVVPMSDPNPAVWEFNRAPSGSAAATLSAVALNPTSVTGGASSTGTVTLSAPAPTGGAVVSLSSNNTAVARVPASVTVAAGATSASFTVSTSAVSANTTVTITASYAGATRTATLTVRLQPPPQVTLSSLSLNPTSVTGGTQSSTGTVALSGPAPSGGAVVSLSSNNTNAARVPASVTVAAGATSASFTVSTSAVSAATTVTISAAYGGATKTAALTVNPPAPPPVTLSSLTLNPTSVTGGTQSSTGTVTLSGPAPTGGAVVSLSSNNTGAAQVPASVTVAAGATTASFTVSTSAVTASTTVTIAAAYAGATKTAALTVKPLLLPTVASLTLNPSSVVGGLQSSTATVTLSAVAPPGGAIVALTRSNSAASVPASVTVPAGTTSASFRVNTSIVLINTATIITASYNNSARTATLSVLL